MRSAVARISNHATIGGSAGEHISYRNHASPYTGARSAPIPKRVSRFGRRTGARFPASIPRHIFDIGSSFDIAWTDLRRYSVVPLEPLEQTYAATSNLSSTRRDAGHLPGDALKGGQSIHGGDRDSFGLLLPAFTLIPSLRVPRASLHASGVAMRKLQFPHHSLP
jgi:hypothetical protein